jgi:hypothetical protein
LYLRVQNEQARIEQKLKGAVRERARVDRTNAQEAAMLGRAQKSAALSKISMVKQRDIAWSKDR